MDTTFLQLASALTLSSLIGFIVLKAKLPLVVAYLLAGVGLSLIALFDPHNSVIFEVLPNIGIAFVLFLIGMELDLREIRALGGPIFIAALGQIVITTLLGYAIAGTMGFNQNESFYIGLGLAFSSTVVVVKMLLEKRDLSSLYGKLSLGISLVEDLVAIAVLMFISVEPTSFHLGLKELLPLVLLVVKAVLLFVLTFLLSRYVLEKIFDAVAKSVELLFLTAITWCFVFTSLALLSGFSVVIGAFLAGVALASSPYHLQIQGKVKPLRDFFVTLFFVYLGTQAKIGDFFVAWPAIILFVLVAMVFKPFIYLLILSLFGFRKHTLFQTSLNLSQVSEFSLIVLLVGKQLGVTSPTSLSVMAAVAVLTIIFSSTMIAYSKKIYPLFAPILPFFEQKTNVHSMEAKIDNELEDHVIVIGAHRVGGPIIKYLEKTKIPFIVMDFNPHIVDMLHKRGLNVIYGDIGDPEVLENLHLERAKLIISTASSIDDNEILLGECRRQKVRAKIIVRALDEKNGRSLKTLGADYVFLPEDVSGDYLVHKIKTSWPKVEFHFD